MGAGTPMRRIPMRRALALTFLIAALCVSSAGVAAAGGASTTTATERLGELDQQVLAEVNRTRQAHGLRRLVVSGGLQKAAGAHSRQMLERGFFAHNAPGGLPFAKRVRIYYRSDGFTTWSAGENLLYSTGEITAEAAVEAWLNSPEHRENMLSPAWREVGVASLRARVAGGTFGGKSAWVITMDFGTRSGKSADSTSAVAARAAKTPTRSPYALLASSPAPSARLGKPKPKGTARGTSKRAVLRILPGGRVAQPV